VSEGGFFPDFFVVGAPRCGTTSLCSYLAGHPAICFSKPKEPHYFSNLGGAGGDLQRDYIERCFAHRRPEHRLAGEGSVSYLYSPVAIDRILALSPRAKFIAMVRNPLEMLLSYHQRLVYLLEEDERELAAAWRLQAARARGEQMPAHCTEPQLLQYAEAGSLGTWLERLFARAGREQCLAVVYDDLAADPAATYARVLGFLGLEPDARTVFRRKQRGRGYRSRALQALLFKPPPSLARLAGVRTSAATQAPAVGAGAAPGAAARPGKGWVRRALRSAGPPVVRLRKRLVRWNSVDVRPRPLPPELREELRTTFAPEVAKLSQLLGRDLSHWVG
jgi:hypothetical protein